MAYSSLNYKDALSASGNKGVTRNFPHTPGIDAAGTVVESGAGDFAKGDEVVLTGFDLGANTDGGFAEYVRVPAAWAVKRPDGLSLKESMVYGTAGFTAALSVLRLQESGVTPDSGDVLVTGATGGVGCLAVGILAHAGYRVVASTGKESEKDFLMGLGAADVISREAAGRPIGTAAAEERVGRRRGHGGRQHPRHRHQVRQVRRRGHLLRQRGLGGAPDQRLPIHPPGRPPHRCGHT